MVMPAKISYVKIMDYAFFCVRTTMRPKYLISVMVCCLVACKGKDDNLFILQPTPGQDYHLTVSIEESNPSTTTEVRDFTLTTRQKDSLCIFNFIVNRIRLTQPASEMVTGKKGQFMVRPAGKQETISSDSNDLMRRLVGDSVQLTINRLGEVRMFTGYENIKRKIVAATGDDPRNISPHIRGYIGEDAMTDLVSQLFFYLPGRIIKPGDQWVSNKMLIEKAPVKYSHLIKVKDIKEDTVQLTVQTVVSARMGEDGTFFGEGELSGEITASLSTGLPEKIELTENFVTHTKYYDTKKKRIIRASMRQSPSR